jgi:predicted DNA-binding protein
MYTSFIRKRAVVRTQIYLTKEEHEGLDFLSKQLGNKKSELIRKAIDQYLSAFSTKNRLRRLHVCRGMWKDREESIFSEIRKEVNRDLSK